LDEESHFVWLLALAAGLILSVVSIVRGGREQRSIYSFAPLGAMVFPLVGSAATVWTFVVKEASPLLLNNTEWAHEVLSTWSDLSKFLLLGSLGSILFSTVMLCFRRGRRPPLTIAHFAAMMANYVTMLIVTEVRWCEVWPGGR